MTSSTFVCLIKVLLLALTFDTGSCIDVEFIMNSTSAHDQDMTCSINGNEDNFEISGIVQIDIFAIFENSERNLASINFISPTPITPIQDKSEATGKLSGKEGFLRLKIKSDQKVLKFSCKVLALDKNRETVRVEKLQENKANLLISILTQRFAGISSGVDLNEAFQKMEEKLEETHKAVVEKTGVNVEQIEHLSKEVNNTGDTVLGVLDIVKSNKDNGGILVDKLSLVEELESDQLQVIKTANVNIYSLSQKLETFTQLVEKISEAQSDMEKDIKQIANRVEELVNLTETGAQSVEFRNCGNYRYAPMLASSPRVTITSQDGIRMMCDTETKGGGWIVFQRRTDGSVNFNRNWADYNNGFGNFESDFWLGLKHLSTIVAKGRWELRVDLEYKGKRFYAEYSHFKIGDASTNYKLSISGYSGTAGDSLVNHNNMLFSTPDRDNDEDSRNCAQVYSSGWWFRECHYVSLNGIWGSKENFKGLWWYELTPSDGSATFTEMKVRKI